MLLCLHTLQHLNPIPKVILIPKVIQVVISLNSLLLGDWRRRAHGNRQVIRSAIECSFSPAPSWTHCFLIVKITGMTFLPLLFLSFLFLSSRKTCSKLSLRFHKINYNDNPKDTFRSNCMINKFQKFCFISFNDLMIYFNDLKVPEGKTHHLAESGVWKVIHFCTGMLVIAKTMWGSSVCMQKLKTWSILTCAVMNLPA